VRKLARATMRGATATASDWDLATVGEEHAGELVDAPPTGDPRVNLRPLRHGDRTIIPLSRRAVGIQAFKTVIPAGAHRPVKPKLNVHEGYEWLYVLDGRLRLLLADRDLTLHPGEAAEFDTRVPHAFGPADEHPVEFLSLFASRANGPTCGRAEVVVASTGDVPTPNAPGIADLIAGEESLHRRDEWVAQRVVGKSAAVVGPDDLQDCRRRERLARPGVARNPSRHPIGIVEQPLRRDDVKTQPAATQVPDAAGVEFVEQVVGVDVMGDLDGQVGDQAQVVPARNDQLGRSPCGSPDGVRPRLIANRASALRRARTGVDGDDRVSVARANRVRVGRRQT
jgi:mannose-6-phosphate isomerase-like protein (cupin superfamily)